MTSQKSDEQMLSIFCRMSEFFDGKETIKMPLSLTQVKELLTILQAARAPSNFDWIGTLMTELEDAIYEATRGDTVVEVKLSINEME